MDSQKINEVIVVEGIKDAQAIRRALGDVEILWTHGFGVTAQQIRYLKRAVRERGVIICTDPDRPGQLIRDALAKKIPGLRHVYVSKSAAQDEHSKKIGIEHASVKTIRKAFAKLSQRPNPEFNTGSDPEAAPQWTLQDLTDLGLNGHPLAALRRRELGKHLQIGDANAKQFVRRLNTLNISREELLSAKGQL